MDAEQTLPQPLWKRVWNFPLVAMLAATALVIAVLAGAEFALPKMFASVPREIAVPVQNVIKVAAMLALYKLAIRHLGERRHDDLRFADAPRGLAIGTAAAFVLFSAIVGVAALIGSYRIVGWGGMGNWANILLGGGVATGFIEELIFRGILFRWIEEFAGSWAALLVTSALFGLGHIGNDNATWFSSVAIAIEAGVMLGGAYMLTRSLWVPVGLHFGWNVTQGLVWDVPVSGHAVDGMVDARLAGDPLLSGGSFGLEASVIALVVAGAFGVWLVKRAADKGEVIAPWWVRRRLAAA